MARTTIMDHIQSISVENARLGRLVLNRRHPHQDYCDPPSTAISSIVPVKSYESFRKGLESSSLAAKFTQFVSAAFTHGSNVSKDISAPYVEIHVLNNSGDWFEKACADANTQKWIERSLKQGRTIYLIVGHCILKDAELVAVRSRDTSASFDAHVPVPMAAGNTLGVQANASYASSLEEKSNAQFPGQVVCAVQYRKLTHKWLSSKTLHNSKLENGNRWTVSGAFRGGDKVEQKDILQVELAEDESDGEEEEVEESEESESEDSSDED